MDKTCWNTEGWNRQSGINAGKICKDLISADVNIVEGNYEPVLITHSYKANKNCDLLFGQTANKFTHDTGYEFYIPDGTFITY